MITENGDVINNYKKDSDSFTTIGSKWYLVIYILVQGNWLKGAITFFQARLDYAANLLQPVKEVVLQIIGKFSKFLPWPSPLQFLLQPETSVNKALGTTTVP